MLPYATSLLLTQAQLSLAVTNSLKSLMSKAVYCTEVRSRESAFAGRQHLMQILSYVT